MIHLPCKKVYHMYTLFSQNGGTTSPNRDKNHPHPRPSAIILEPRVFSTPILSRSGIIIETRAMASPRRKKQRLEGSRGRWCTIEKQKADRPCPTSGRNEASPVCKWHTTGLHPLCNRFVRTISFRNCSLNCVSKLVELFEIIMEGI